MQTKSELELGWEFAAKLVGADFSAQAGHAYVSEVAKAIEQLEIDINNHPYRGQDVGHFQGYVQEVWHADTFNVDAVAAGSSDRAHVLNSHGKGSVDVALDSGTNYSAKSYVNGEKTAAAQAKLNRGTGTAEYIGQKRLGPSDQMADAKAAAHRQALRNQEIRPEVSAAYSETEINTVDRVSNDEGIESRTATRKELEDMARAGKKQEFSAEDAGVTLDNSITTEYMLKQAMKAGYTAAAITVAMQLAPEIYKAVDYLIKHKEIDVQQIKKAGIKVLSTGAEAFLRGSVSCSLLIMCEKGVFGAALKSVSPTILGSVVAIVMETVKNSILVAAGKMSARQMGGAFVDCLVVSGGYLLGAEIGGIIVQAIGWEFPVAGYLLGSLIGTAFAAVYQFGKKKLISFCADSGFTCFGLVEQNYELPEEILNDLGINVVPVPRTEISRTEIKTNEVSNQLGRAEYETIDIKVLRRGVIGVNKVGYVVG